MSAFPTLDNSKNENNKFKIFSTNNSAVNENKYDMKEDSEDSIDVTGLFGMTARRTSLDNLLASPDCMSPFSSSPIPSYDPNIWTADRFKKLEKRGKGRYGSVYKAYDKATGNIVGLKKMELHRDEDGILSTTIREIAILKELNHPNVIRLRGNYTSYRRKIRNDLFQRLYNEENEEIIRDEENEKDETNGNQSIHERNRHLMDNDTMSSQLYLVFDFVDKDLNQYLDEQESQPFRIGMNGIGTPGIELSLMKEILKQILAGLNYCHRHQILHRDIKPQNILINASSSPPLVKIADFGLSRTFTPPIRPLTNEVVTLWYRSPELLLGSSIYTPPVDMWSVGVIAAELARCGLKKSKSNESRGYRPLFQAKWNILQLFKIFSVRGTPDDNVWPGVTSLPYWNDNFPKWFIKNLENYMPGLSQQGLDFVDKCLTLDPRKRLTSYQGLQHQFLVNLDPKVDNDVDHDENENL